MEMSEGVDLTNACVKFKNVFREKKYVKLWSKTEFQEIISLYTKCLYSIDV